ncbi:mycolate reductase [Corynebacterium sp. CCM 9185]|uniref:SDR family oxidoreductase n=1 Tax=Corynebacterium marambiense TaxID=2765364 RepID=A0ABS0W0N5_9CORY|nr:mycolate reductase [Corynebacterium marambiense]MBI9001430.1 SDR family oxidoreductase [Corynebacterium marambiense]MCK7664045.1 mycolate reductase [Corynebacterium marambiense]MCX7543380.1 mycolate reductase [Corynebacterium marambiense]
MALPSPRKDARALVTGASQGIGMAMARDLARLGHNLILVARREDVLRTFADELETTHRVTVDVRPCDLADPEARKTLIDEITDLEIDIIINSAGIASFGAFMDQDWTYETTQFQLNAAAVFELTRAVLPGMLERKSGAICNVGSAAGNMPIPNNATYVFTKAGVNAFTEALHYELRGTGVTCTLLAPGPVRDAVIDEADKSIVDKVVPDFLWTTYESCSRETLRAMSGNRRRVVPGPLGKAMDRISAVMPTAISAPIMGSFYKKMG